MPFASAIRYLSRRKQPMRSEFAFNQIQSVEFCVNVRTNGSSRTNYLMPIDRSVQDALKQVLDATLVAIEPEDGRWNAYELSEKTCFQRVAAGRPHCRTDGLGSSAAR